MARTKHRLHGKRCLTCGKTFENWAEAKKHESGQEAQASGGYSGGLSG